MCSVSPMGTPFTELVGCSLPLQLAPMSGVGTPELLTAVVEAGGMAMMAAVMTPPPALEAQLDDLAHRSEGPVGVNFLLLVEVDRKAIEIAAARSRYVDFYHSAVDADLVRLVHAGGALAGWQVNSVEQARAAEDAGCDLIVVRGIEGGGRMHGDSPLRPLLDEVIEALDVPVLAAGGLATRQDVADCLALGAAGVRMGTRFVATEESGAHPFYKQAIVAAAADDAIVTDAFSVGLPHAGAAGVLRSALEAAQASRKEIVGETRVGGQPLPVPRLSPFPPTRDTIGDLEAMALHAGRSAGKITSVEPAGVLVRALFDQAGSPLPN